MGMGQYDHSNQTNNLRSLNQNSNSNSKCQIQQKQPPLRHRQRRYQQRLLMVQLKEREQTNQQKKAKQKKNQLNHSQNSYVLTYPVFVNLKLLYIQCAWTDLCLSTNLTETQHLI